jgi:hypothetical protein
LKDPSVKEVKFNGKYVFKKDKYPVMTFGVTLFWSVEGPWVDGKPHGLCIF